MITITPTSKKLLAISRLKGVGPVTLRQLCKIKNIDSLEISEIAEQYPQIANALELPGAWEFALCFSEEQEKLAAQHQAQILCILDEDYPYLLKLTPDAPCHIFVRGKLQKDKMTSVAVIGTRKPTQHGSVITERITRFFVENEWSIVSGLAIGCDAVAHRTALEHRGHTVAVLAHGLHTTYPKEHKNLAEEIVASGGAIVSEYCFGTGTRPGFFVKRDRIQAGLASGVFMVQSDVTGGSLHASRASLEYGRWLASPYPTNKDIAANEAKIQANLILSSDDTLKKIHLLKCQRNALERNYTIWAKEDYHMLLNISKEISITNESQEIKQNILF